METSSIPAVLETLRRAELLAVNQLNEVIRADKQGRFGDLRSLGRELVQRGRSTPYQVNQLAQGRAAELILGPYVFLDRLGEGGAGQVFKARHRHLNRLVAVKLIRKDNLQDPEAIARFQREIKAISQLDHPNVVRASDAGPIANSFFLAMDYVEGIDLGRLVKTAGRLPIPRAVRIRSPGGAGIAIHPRARVGPPRHQAVELAGDRPRRANPRVGLRSSIWDWFAWGKSARWDPR